LKKTAADNKNWYVCEREISVSEIVDIEVNGKPFNDYDQIMEFIRSLSSGLSGIRVSLRFAPPSGHRCVCQRPPCVASGRG
jgi:hypothetical protein